MCIKANVQYICFLDWHTEGGRKAWIGFSKAGYQHKKRGWNKFHSESILWSVLDPRFYYKNQFGIISQTKYVVRESLVTTSYPMVWDETSLATHQWRHWLLLIPWCVSEDRARKGAIGDKEGSTGFLKSDLVWAWCAHLPHFFLILGYRYGTRII